MALSERLNNYCERLGPEFWSEPLNAVTNAAFLVAALLAFVLWRRKTPDDAVGLILILIVFLTGVGSFLFHTVATRWALLADVIPIALFIHLYLFWALKRYLEIPWWGSLLIVGVFFALTPVIARMAAPLVGNLGRICTGLAGGLRRRQPVLPQKQPLGCSGVAGRCCLRRVADFSHAGRTIMRSAGFRNAFLVAYSQRRCALRTVAGSHFASRRLNLGDVRRFARTGSVRQSADKTRARRSG